MLPDVQAYFDAIETADKVYNEAAGIINQEHPYPRYSDTNYDAKVRAHYDALTPVNEAFTAAKETAHAKLRDSEDKLIAWIASGPLKSYYGEAKEVLEALPLTREQMDTFGGEQGWCPEYGRLYREAEAAGVLPEYGDPKVALISKMASCLHANNGGRYAFNATKAAIEEALPQILALSAGIDVERLVDDIYGHDYVRYELKDAILRHVTVTPKVETES